MFHFLDRICPVFHCLKFLFVDSTQETLLCVSPVVDTGLCCSDPPSEEDQLLGTEPEDRLS